MDIIIVSNTNGFIRINNTNIVYPILPKQDLVSLCFYYKESWRYA